MQMPSDYFYMMDIFLFDDNISSVKNENFGKVKNTNDNGPLRILGVWSEA